jgi:hypothetical protein
MSSYPVPFELRREIRHDALLDVWLKHVLFYAHAIGRHRGACVVLIIALTIGLRCALLPWLPRPQPYAHDEFSYLLGADTFASGRLANPAHPLWQFFESCQIIAHPTYAMKYQPGQAAFLALGQVLFGDPYWGVVISTALMTGAICWMMQAFLLPGWALIGGLFTAAVFGGGQCWIQSYWGGSVAALASALTLGAFMRIAGSGRHRFIWLFAVGSALGLLTRPYEAGVFAAILTLALIIGHAGNRSWIALRRMVLPYALVMSAWACFQMYYDWRITGHPLKLPYILHEEQYAVAPTFWMLPPRNVPQPRDPELYSLHWVWEKDEYEAIRNMAPLSRMRRLLTRAIIADPGRPGLHTTVPDLVGAMLYVLLLTPAFWFSRRVRGLTVLAALLALSSCLIVWTYLHYLGPFLVVLLALLFLLTSYLRGLTVRGRRVGNVLVALILLYLPLKPLLIARSAVHVFSNGDDEPFVKQRARIIATLQRADGRHVVIVRYKPNPPLREWVYNSANIDAQKIVWARDRGAVENRKLLAYYRGRNIWVVYANESPVLLEPYRE